MDRLIRETDPLTHTTVYTYYIAGLQIGLLDAKGQSTTFSLAQPGGGTQRQTITYNYDELYRLTATVRILPLHQRRDGQPRPGSHPCGHARDYL